MFMTHKIRNVRMKRRCQRMSVNCHGTGITCLSLFIRKEGKMLHGSWVCADPQLRAALSIRQTWISG